MQPIKGFDGTVTVAGQDVAWISEWEVNLEVEEQTVGPFIGDNGNKYTFVTSRELSGTFTGTVPSGKDAGQTAIISGALNGNYVSISLVTNTGYTVTVPSGLITTFGLTQTGEESIGITAEFRSSGSFTVV